MAKFNFKSAIQPWLDELEAIAAEERQIELERMLELAGHGVQEVVIPSGILYKIYQIVHDFPGREVSWYLLGNTIGKVHTVEDIYFPHQYSTAVTTETSDKDAHRKEMADVFDECGLSCLIWCHSHHSMGVNPSGQDVKQLKENAIENLKVGMPAIRMIVNNNCEIEMTQMVGDVEVDVDLKTMNDNNCDTPVLDATYVKSKNATDKSYITEVAKGWGSRVAYTQANRQTYIDNTESHYKGSVNYPDGRNRKKNKHNKYKNYR